MLYLLLVRVGLVDNSYRSNWFDPCLKAFVDVRFFCVGWSRPELTIGVMCTIFVDGELNGHDRISH